MTNKISLVALLLMAGVSPGLMAAETAELKVSGQISGPTCDVSVGGGTIDYGEITVASLNSNADQDTVLSSRALPSDISITCNARTSILVSFTDSRFSSAGGNVSPITHLVTGYSLAQGAGLGTDSAGNKVGGYDAFIYLPMVDGLLSLLYQTDGANPALLQGAGHVIAADGDTEFGFGNRSGGAAIGQVFALKYSVAAKIAPRNNLDLTRPIDIDGSLALQVNYL